MCHRPVGGGLGLSSWLWGHVFPGALASSCPLGVDPTHPDHTVCELAFGGLWISLAIGLAAGALSTGLGLLVAAVARLTGGALER